MAACLWIFFLGGVGGVLFVQFASGAFHKLLLVCVFSYFPFGSEGRMWDLIVSVPDHCLSFYFSCKKTISGKL